MFKDIKNEAAFDLGREAHINVESIRIDYIDQK